MTARDTDRTDDLIGWTAVPGARSPSWRPAGDLPVVDRKLLDALEQRVRTGDSKARVTLHADAGAALQEMVIAQRPQGCFPPKRHPHKPKTFLGLRGRLLVVVFSDSGEPVRHQEVGPEADGVVCHIPPGWYHMDLPLAPVSIHYECTLGPFQGDGDKEFPVWGFRPDDQIGRETFLDTLCRRLGRANPFGQEEEA